MESLDVSSRLITGMHSRGALPHLKSKDGTYFVTFRLAGTLPRDVLQRLKAERESLVGKAVAGDRPLTWGKQKELFEWYAAKVDRELDAGRGECWLAQATIAEIVAGALKFFSGERYDLRAWVVMPNHVHAVVRPREEWTLSSILKSWKGFTAVKGNRFLGREGESFWQRESYDHLCRDEDDLGQCCVYATHNPVAAGLCGHPEHWRWSSAYMKNDAG